MNAAVVMAWQISPLCNCQAAGPRAQWDQGTPGHVPPAKQFGKRQPVDRATKNDHLFSFYVQTMYAYSNFRCLYNPL